MKYDFSGYATKNNVKCADGRVIKPNAFADCDGTTVPLVYQHVHTDPLNVLGHAVLENREDGVYAYCSFNETESGKHAKELVKHGDINSLSIYANRLKQQGSDVLHGIIREVSMVLAGANPLAKIDNVSFAHADGFEYESEDDVIIEFGLPVDEISHADDEEDEEDEISHADDEKKDQEDQNGSESKDESSDDETVEDVYNNMSEKKKTLVDYMVAVALNGGVEEEIEEEIQQSDIEHSDEETIADVWDSFTEKEKNVANYMVAKALEAAEEDEEMEHFDEGDDYMYQNIFAQTKEEDYKISLTHDDMTAIVEDAKKGNGSLKDAICHFITENFEVPEGSSDEEVLQHGIEQLDILFPEAKLVSDNPEMISRPMEWVGKVWNATKKSPFSRIKTVAADVTADEARARGYVKGKKKIEEVVKLLKRKTTPQTVYKLQKLDRDDVLDATEINVVVWLKSEMRMMLNEEISRAVLIGDGREETDESKISEDNIRPVYTDDDLFTIKTVVEITDDMDRLEKSDVIVDAAVESRSNYMGSGSPTMYASTETINMMLLARDKVGHRLYKTLTELADACLVKEIVEVPVIDTATRETEDGDKRKLLALIVNLSDYTIGADRGGEVNLFDDFDINYNKYEYLIETRCSGALTKPYSAIAIEMAVEELSTPSKPGDGDKPGDGEEEQQIAG